MKRAVHRPFTKREDHKIYVARTAAEYLSINTRGCREIRIEIYNKRNPNAILVTYWPKDQTWRAQRWINEAWVREKVR